MLYCSCWLVNHTKVFVSAPPDRSSLCPTHSRTRLKRVFLVSIFLKICLALVLVNRAGNQVENFLAAVAVIIINTVAL